MTKIVSYKSTHKNEIDALMHEIALEYEENILPKQTSATPKVPIKYWVAINNKKIIGTVGILIIEKDVGILKKMMLKKSFVEQHLEYQKPCLILLLNGVRKMVFQNFILVP